MPQIEETMYTELDAVGTDAELATLIAVLERVVARSPAGEVIAARVGRKLAARTSPMR